MGARAWTLVMVMLCVTLCWSAASASGGVGDGPRDKPSAHGGGGIGDRPGSPPSVEPSPAEPEAPVEPEVGPDDPQAQDPPSAAPESAPPPQETQPGDEPRPEERPQQPQAQTSDEPVARDYDPNMDPGGPTVAGGTRYPSGGGGSVPSWIPEVLMRLPWIVAGSQVQQWMPRPSWSSAGRAGWRTTRQPWDRRRR